MDGEEGFVISKPLVLLVAVSLEEEGMDKALGLEEKGEEEGVQGVGGLEMENPRCVLAFRIREWIRASGPKAKRIISFSPWS